MFLLALQTTPEPGRDNIRHLYEDYRKSLYRIAFGILHNDAQAEDAVQQAFVRLIENSQKINNLSADKLAGYAVITVRNTAINLYRRNQGENLLPLEEYTEAEAADESVEELVLHSDSIDRLREAIRELPPIYADTLILRYQRDLTDAEIAKLLGITEGNVRTRLCEGRKRLKKRMEMEGADV